MTGVCVGQVLSRVSVMVWDADAVRAAEGNTQGVASRETPRGPTWSETLRMHRNTSHENREVSCFPAVTGTAAAEGTEGRIGKSKDARR